MRTAAHSIEIKKNGNDLLVVLLLERKIINQSSPFYLFSGKIMHAHPLGSVSICQAFNFLLNCKRVALQGILFYFIPESIISCQPNFLIILCK